MDLARRAAGRLSFAGVAGQDDRRPAAITVAVLRSLSAAVLAAAALALTGLPAAAQPIPQHLPTPAPNIPAPPSGPHARYSKAPINLAPPTLALTAALIAAGGGAGTFDAQKLVGTLTGNGPSTQTQLADLTKTFGPENVASFVKTFDYVVTDALNQFSTAGIMLPATPSPDPGDGKALAAALYAAGIMPRGGFDVEYMLDSLVSHVVHVAVMNDIDADPALGPKADANYHQVLAQLMRDLKAADKL